MVIQTSNLIRNIRRASSSLRFFLNAEKEWCKIQKKDVVVYDAASVQVLSPFLSDYGIVYLRGERMNFRILVRAALSKNFTKDPQFAYAIQSLRYFQPRIIVTTIDNDPRFYSVSSYFPNSITIMVQNGVRDDIFDVWSLKDDFPIDPSVNHMVVFGNIYGEFVKKYIAGNVLIAGSIRSNGLVPTASIKTKSILFISQITRTPDDSVFGAFSDGTTVSHYQYSRAEAELLPLIERWCLLNNYQLKILARTGSTEEQNFYSDVLSSANWDYCITDEEKTCYHMVDESAIAVGIDSTLVLESLGRRNRTAVFSIRKNYIENFSSVFWPGEMEDDGPFWTSRNSAFEVNRILSFLIEADSSTWENCLTEYVSDHVIFDNDNSRLKNLLTSVTSN